MSNTMILVYDEEADIIAAAIEHGLKDRGITAQIQASSDYASASQHIPAAEILVASPFPTDLLMSATSLKWVQSLWAGVDSWMNADFANPVPVTRMCGNIFAKYMAEYVYAHLLFEMQCIAQLREAQQNRNWTSVRPRTLAHKRLGVGGIGSIGGRVAMMGKAFGMEVSGLRRSADTYQPAEQPAYVDHVFGPSDLTEFVSHLDVLVLALPSTVETADMFDREVLNALPPGATVINIGRGQVLDVNAAVDLLREGHLNRVILDTFSQEPLPETSPLWNEKRLVITPHISGPVYPDEVAAVSVDNIVRFMNGEIPEPVIDMAKGY